MIADNEYLALIVQHDAQTSAANAEAYTSFSVDNAQSLDSELSHLYILTSDPSIIAVRNTQTVPESATKSLLHKLISTNLSLKKKYKPVAKKVKPVIGAVPEDFCIVRKIEGDPFTNLPDLSPNPPPFIPTGRYMQERMERVDQTHPLGFLWPTKRALMHHFMSLQNAAFAWTDLERGHFCTDFFPPIVFPVIPHMP